MSKRERYAALAKGEDVSLDLDHFRPTTEAVNLDPLIETQIMVTLDQLKPYDRNPRKSRNPKYEEIKDSIRSRGLDNKPNITRRPGDGQYMIVSGGNTRLAILNELWQETRDEGFYRLTCLFVPWKGEIYAMTGHLIENDARGEMTFIDRALAIKELHTIYEADAGKSISQNALAGMLKESGYGVSQAHISKMFYALEHLLPALPITLREGLGKHQVERLIKLRNACQKAFALFEPDASVFGLAFAGTLAEHDLGVEAWDIQRLQDALTAKLAGLAGLSINRFALEVDAAMLGRSTAAEPEDAAVQAPGLPPFSAAEREPERPASLADARPPAPAARPDGRTHPQTAPSPDDASPPPSVRPAARAATNLAELRQQNHALAIQIARFGRFAELVFPYDNLNGFLVDLPAADTSFAALQQAGGPPAASLLWRLLFSLSEIFTVTTDLEPVLPLHDPRPEFEGLRPDARLVHLNALFNDWLVSNAPPHVLFQRCRERTSQNPYGADFLHLIAPQLLSSIAHQELYERMRELYDSVRRCQELRLADPGDVLFGNGNG